MNCRYLACFICLLVLLTVVMSSAVAQDGGPQAPVNLPPVGPGTGWSIPQAGQLPNPGFFGGTPSQVAPALPQGFGSPESGVPLLNQPGQQGAQGTSSTPASPKAPTTSPAPEPLSSIEVAFRDTTAVRTPAGGAESPGFLRQFGYSLFSRSISTFAPVEDVPVGPDYILGPGDDLRIQIWGAMERGLLQTVDRNGQIYLPTVGPLRVWGLSFSQADQLIRENLSRYYRGFQASVSMGRLRTIRIYVVGEVHQPGSFTISSLSTVTNALFAAGGPIRVGSLRKVELKRNHHSVGTFDLYDFLLRGDKTRDFRLESGDTIFIPPIGPVVAIAGEVKRPAIYELNGTTRLNDLIEMAGGTTPQSYLKRVQVIRAKPNAEREVIDLDLTTLHGNGDSPVNIELRNGDLIKIYPTDPRVYNTVTLAGVVKHPGEYELKPGMKVSQLVPQGALLPEAHAERVELIRFTENLTTEVIQLNLKEVWSGNSEKDLALRARDQITVRSEFQGHRSVTLSGEVKLPGTYPIFPGERLSSVIRRAGGYTDKAFFKGAVFTRKSVQDTEKKRLEEFIRRQEEALLSDAKARLQPVSLEDQQARQIRQTEKRDQIRLIASRVTLGRIVIRLNNLQELEGTRSDLLLEDGDTLMVPQAPATVLVMGSVRNPTAILHNDGEDIEYYLNRAGGFEETAEPKEMYLLKADGSALTGFLRLKEVEPGDAIIVPAKTKERDWSLLKDIAALAGQTALGLAALAAIF
ncbi:MAG: SLBB domain-containing protein [Deltaproteobacteria bacterium]|nr:SLBB domain-containing protein [Deltaproteobacteria bacterium]